MIYYASMLIVMLLFHHNPDFTESPEFQFMVIQDQSAPERWVIGMHYGSDAIGMMYNQAQVFKNWLQLVQDE